jgi:hypothetical protein
MRVCLPAIATGAALAAAVGACSPYAPKLSNEPFLCGSSAPKCPDGYSCTGTNGSGQPTCLLDSATGPDAANLESMCANDSELMNNTLSTAFVTSVDTAGTNNMVTYTGLSICPIGDTDFFKFTVSQTNEAFRALVTYQTWGAPLAAAVLDTTGLEQYPFNTVAGSANTIKAFSTNIATGAYIIEIQAAPGSNVGINNYTLEIELCMNASTPPCNM